MEKLNQAEMNELRHKFQEKRYETNKTLRAVAQETKISIATLTRFENKVGVPLQKTLFLIKRFVK